jgi:hypothetical protein
VDVCRHTSNSCHAECFGRPSCLAYSFAPLGALAGEDVCGMSGLGRCRLYSDGPAIEGVQTGAHQEFACYSFNTAGRLVFYLVVCACLYAA